MASHQEYDSGMSKKVRKTLTLDPEVVETFGDDPNALSATVNSILHEEMARRTSRATLAAFVARLDAEFGEPDPSEVERFRRALS
jgi:hypothetical protein